MKNEKAIEPYSQIMEVIHSLEGGRQRILSASEIRNELLSLLENVSVIDFKFHRLKNIVRGRILDNESDPFTDLADLTARKHVDVKEFGRCNRPGFSVSYASNNIETALAELRAHMGQRIQFIEASLRPDVLLGVVCVGIIDYYRRHEIPPPILGAAAIEHIVGRKDLADEMFWKQVEIIDAFIAAQFRKQVSRPFDYNITSAYAGLNFELPGVDCLIYPSVGHMGGWNFAITPEAFDRLFVVTKSYVSRVLVDAGYGIYVMETEAETDRITETKICW